jgi:hypothetical protein
MMKHAQCHVPVCIDFLMTPFQINLHNAQIIYSRVCYYQKTRSLEPKLVADAAGTQMSARLLLDPKLAFLPQQYIFEDDFSVELTNSALASSAKLDKRWCIVSQALSVASKPKLIAFGGFEFRRGSEPCETADQLANSHASPKKFSSNPFPGDFYVTS